MKRKCVQFIGLVAVVAASVTLAIVVPHSGRGESSDKFTAVSRETPSGQPAENIAVHGHWTVEVRNPDGSLAERREFENALQTTFGEQTLAKLLARTVTLGGWSIVLTAPSSSVVSPFTSGPGFIVESTYPRTESNHFKTLTISTPTSGENRNKLVLRGTATAQRDGSIGAVDTLVDVLNAAEARTGPYLMMDTGFTGTTLSAPVNLTTGQTVTVTVVIGFS